MTTLPPLRQDLQLRPGAPLVTGAPSWTLFDPVRHLFFQIGRLEHAVLSHWSRGDAAMVRQALTGDGMPPEAADRAIRQVLEFVLANSLTRAPTGDAVARFMGQREAGRTRGWRWLLRNYLFVRIPLLRPARFLERTLPFVEPFFRPGVPVAFALVALVGLVLTGQHWDRFAGSFIDLLSLQGLFAYALALAGAKAAHELGHAYAATRFGCRVPTMGISFLVMMPVLYTDTTAAWTLRSRRQRLLIDGAGIAVELMIAVVATLLWHVLPDGPAASAAFVLATTTWITSLLINLSPFLRFDGYYLLSDLLGVPNLQPRAFALGRWRLRELLFDLGEPPPETMPDRLRRGLIVYAWCTWVYRLVLYVGIALLVYHLFFKLLGLVLFAVELFVFIGRPLVAEFREWHRRRTAIRTSRRSRAWLLAAFGLVLAILLPIDRHVGAPAVLTAIGDQPLVPGEAGRIERILVDNGREVRRADPLLILASPELDRDRETNRIRIARLQARLARSIADRRDLFDRALLERELATERGIAAGLAQRHERLVLRAPADGRVVDLDPDLHPGRWIAASALVARIVTPGRYDVQAYVDERDVRRLRTGAPARFVPDDVVQPSRRARLVETAGSGAAVIDLPMLTAPQGGPIAVTEDGYGGAKPRSTVYRVRLVATRDAEGARAFTQQATPGRIVIDAEPESLAARWLHAIGRIAVRESSLGG